MTESEALRLVQTFTKRARSAKLPTVAARNYGIAVAVGEASGGSKLDALGFVTNYRGQVLAAFAEGVRAGRLVVATLYELRDGDAASNADAWAEDAAAPGGA